jgi:alkanesulfonate monooxygenase SsuD/methylene tetrahydromethanopterin reductase-like flavin-dependent oxidoreductase (luciferase family)
VAIGNQDIAVQGQAFLARYYNRPYDAIGNAMLCVIGSPNQVMDQLETYVDAGARTIILRFAADDQRRQLQLCAEWLQRRRLMS